MYLYFDKFREQMTEFAGREQKLMKERQAAAETATERSTYMIAGGILVAIIVALIVSLMLAGSITRPFKQIFQGLKAFSTAELEKVGVQFKDVIRGLTNGSHQVAAASQQMASGASQQAASLEETSSSLEEMSTMTKTNADNASQGVQ